MDHHFSLAGATPSLRSTSPWLYRRSAMRGLVELARVQGFSVGLPIHFHDEDQITFVLAGRRRFQIGGGLVEVGPGQGIRIAAGTPHSSRDEPSGVVCFNAYIPAGCAAGGIVAAMTRRWHETGCLSLPELAAMVRADQHDPERSVVAVDLGSNLRGHDSVQGAAANAGMSREGFSRAFRRTYGVAPSVFRSLSNLNAARRLLRAGMPLAAVAAEAGFADQSHLGRCFRRTFGVTPGHYRAGWDRSHPFQTGPRQSS